jgi:hypothetical protein
MNRTGLFLALSLSLSALAQQASRPHKHMPSLSPEDQAAIRNTDLTSARIEKILKAGVRMRDYVKAHPEVRQNDFMEGRTLDQSVKFVESKPEMVAIMKAEGVTPREWLLGVMAFNNAAMWSEISKRSPNQPTPPMVNPKNVALLQAHPELVQKWMDAWEGPDKQ